MTDEMIKKLDDYATQEVKRLGVDVRKHEFFISEGPYYKKRRTCDVIRLEPKQFYQTLTEQAPREDLGPALSLMAETLYTFYCGNEIEQGIDGEDLPDSTRKFINDMWTLWSAGIPALIAWDRDYVYGGRLHPEDYCLIQCHCGKMIMVPRYTGDLILETTCPICGSLWEYENEQVFHPYTDTQGIVTDYKPLYDIPQK